MTPGFLRNAIVLGLMAAVGPFAIDMYLPALPTIAADLSTSTAATQMTLMVFFISFGACQIFYGPAADMMGRKPPLYFGLSYSLWRGSAAHSPRPSVGSSFSVSCRALARPRSW